MNVCLLIAYIGNLIDLIATLYLTNQGFYEVNPIHESSAGLSVDVCRCKNTGYDLGVSVPLEA